MASISLLNSGRVGDGGLARSSFGRLINSREMGRVVRRTGCFKRDNSEIGKLVFYDEVSRSIRLSGGFGRAVGPRANEFFQAVTLGKSTARRRERETFRQLTVSRGALSAAGRAGMSRVFSAREARGVSGTSKGVRPLSCVFSIRVLGRNISVIRIGRIVVLEPARSPVMFVRRLKHKLEGTGNGRCIIVLSFVNGCGGGFVVPITLSKSHSCGTSAVEGCIVDKGGAVPNTSAIRFSRVTGSEVFTSVSGVGNVGSVVERDCISLGGGLKEIPCLLSFCRGKRISPLMVVGRCGACRTFLRTIRGRLCVNELGRRRGAALRCLSGAVVDNTEPFRLRVLERLVGGPSVSVGRVERVFVQECSCGMGVRSVSGTTSMLRKGFIYGSSRCGEFYEVSVLRRSGGGVFREVGGFAAELRGRRFGGRVSSVVRIKLGECRSGCRSSLGGSDPFMLCRGCSEHSMDLLVGYKQSLSSAVCKVGHVSSSMFVFIACRGRRDASRRGGCMSKGPSCTSTFRSGVVFE